MKERQNLIVMLTHNDKTVDNAYEAFEKCKNAKAGFFGMKEEPLSLEEMKKLFGYIKSFGKQTFLEVVAYSEKEGLDGAKMAAECKCDYLMGTKYFDSINVFCKENQIKYMPFIGEVLERPSILEGNIDEMIREAKKLLKKGVYGFDLLGYRYTGNAVELNKRFVSEINAPVCIAGSVNSYQRLDEIKDANPWAFTIGGAFFEHQFGDDFEEQINKVCEYMEKAIVQS
ncbi:MAG: hypothetical protein II919_02950 [Lachnospiraceae bacterium]|nr:hypothetical protein [Lachnospiraceae bacterium]